MLKNRLFRVLGIFIFSLFFVTPAQILLGQTPLVWGGNLFGQLGNGTNTSSNVPNQISNATITAIAGGAFHSLYLRNDGTVWAWGLNDYGQLGNGTQTNSNVPVQVQGLINVTTIATGDFHSLALKSDGTVWAWGRNDQGQLGCGTDNNSSAVPIQVLNLSGVTAIAGGGYHCLALKNDGTVWAWGRNAEGQLGDTTNTNRNSPVEVLVKKGSNIILLSGATAIAAGNRHSLALRNLSGTISAWAWGLNDQGQLGNGTYNSSNSAYMVALNFTDIAAIAGGGYHSLALKNDGTVWAWGESGASWLDNGSGDNLNSLTPAQISNLTGVAAIAGGGSHSLALKNDGTVWAWGDNGDGQLGNGTNADCDGPVQVLNITGATAIAAGGWHSLAIKAGSGGCISNATTLCVNNRFKVQVTWWDYSGNTGPGTVVPYQKSDSGLFWFFDPTTWEMLVNVHNGCNYNGHYWVYAAAKTDVQYKLYVTDTSTGVMKEYDNPPHTQSSAITDDTAFASCP